MNTHCLLAAACFFVALSSPSSAAPKTFPTSEGLMITLDERWNEIPKSLLDQLSTSKANGLGQQEWNYAYQISESTDSMNYPYILIQIKNTGRVVESELQDAAKAMTNAKANPQDLEKLSNGQIKSASTETVEYDAKAHTMISKASINSGEPGELRTLTALKLTKDGLIQFHGYALPDQAAEFMPFFEKAVADIELPPDMVYQVSGGDESFLSKYKWSEVGRNALIGGVLGAILVLVKNLRNKRKAPATSTPTAS